jgi:hypothetical protein
LVRKKPATVVTTRFTYPTPNPLRNLLVRLTGVSDGKGLTGERPSVPLVLGINLGESRTRNYARELQRRGYEIVELSVQSLSQLWRALQALWAARARTGFVLMGAGIPWQIPVSYLAQSLGKAVVLDCPMDITEWPFPEVRHTRLLTAMLLRLVDRVLTVETRSYFREKFGLRDDALVCVESCPDEEDLRGSASARPRITIPPGAFVICCSTGAVHHRLELFLPIFEKLAEILPQAILLVIGDEAQPLVRAARDLATRPDFKTRVKVLPIIKPIQDFFATVSLADLWIATMGDESVQGDREFRMELFELAWLRKPVAATRTSALAHHGLVDGETVIFLNRHEPEATAQRLADLSSSPERLRTFGLRLNRLLAHHTLAQAVDRIVAALPAAKADPASLPGAKP